LRQRKVGILGATGLVGQRLVEKLVDHPWFEIVALAASERSVGRPYADAANWAIGTSPPAAVRDLLVRPCNPEEFEGCDLVFSALDTGPAREVEPAVAAAGFVVVSNSSAHRQHEDVPLLIPEVNAGHLVVAEARRSRSGGGFIVTNPNCSVIGLALAVAPLHREFRIRRLVVTTLQAVSGAGMEGPRALSMLDNVIPHIPGEETKIESELSKIFGTPDGGRVRPDGLAVSAHCHRVPVSDGHLESVSLELDRPVTPVEAVRALRSFVGEIAELELPSAPASPIVVLDEEDRPQPRLDRGTGGGMSVVVGRVRSCAVLGLKLEVLSHNTVRGAAGGTILIA
jgi:aspartate-semialdehyde dehydrogenase